jgi:EAL domain-containing protein (putative c-di-GMP-specific phosphodiesterase class I)
VSYYLRYQPIIDVQQGRDVIGYESFVCGSMGEPPSVLFRRYAAQLAAFDNQLMNRAIAEAMPLLKPSQQLFLNVHPKTLYAGFQLPEGHHHQIVLEIMESTTYSARIKQQLNHLAMKGLSFAYDDFGVKHANLDRLLSTSFRPTWLKLDRSFIAAYAAPQVPLIIRFILELCELMEIKLIVEGVESEAQLQLLKNNGVRYVQGYHLGKPQTEIEGVSTRMQLSQRSSC